MGLGAWSLLASRPLLQTVLGLLAHWAVVRRGRLFPLGRTWFLIILIRFGVVELVVAVTIASASCLVMIRIWRWVEIGKRLPSVGRSWTSTSPLGRYCRCYNIHLLLRSLVFTLTMALVLLLLHLLLLPLTLINEENVERRVNLFVFVCHASTGMKTTLVTELGLWRRSAMRGGGLKEEVVASDLAWRDPSVLSCNGSLEGREEGV